MPLVYYVPEYERDASQTPLDAERLLRLLGLSGKLTGFRYAIYMVEQVRDQPENMFLITKRLYAQTAEHFRTTPSCVERNLRTLIQRCWNYPDHSFLNLIAGAEFRHSPFGTNVPAAVHPCGLATVRELNRSIGYIRYAPERKAVRD